MDLGLAGKNAIVTGGSKGIGFAIAQALVAEGAHVAICARGAEGVADAVAALGETDSGGTAWGSAVDVADIDAYIAWIGEATEQLGALDIFIGNIAFTPNADAEARWKAAFDVDLMHCVRGSDAAMPALKASGDGSIVFISSVSGIMTELPPEETAYAAMKAALVSYASQLAQTAAADGVRVNVVTPGPTFVEGGTWDMIRQAEPDFYEFALGLPALGRMGKAEEIAASVAFLASPMSSFTTGANLRVDGGTVKSVQH